jgi:hypothetical protein
VYQVRIGKRTVNKRDYDHGVIIYTHDNSKAKNVSYNKLRDFLIKDNTQHKEYIQGKFACSHFCMMLHDKAETAGIRCGLVIIHYKKLDYGHVLNVFDTTDRGIIYIEPIFPTSVAKLEIGKHDVYTTLSGLYKQKRRGSGVIKDIEVIWHNKGTHKYISINNS